MVAARAPLGEVLPEHNPAKNRKAGQMIPFTRRRVGDAIIPIPLLREELVTAAGRVPLHDLRVNSTALVVIRIRHLTFRRGGNARKALHPNRKRHAEHLLDRALVVAES